MVHVISALAVGVLSALCAAASPPPPITWTMINVNPGSLQADAHLLRLPDGTVFMIDTGDRENRLVPFLKAQGVARIDHVFISHFHKDHYEGIRAILDAGIKVGAFHANKPDRAVCDGERPWGCDWQHIEVTLAYLRKNGVPVLPIKPSTSVYENGEIHLDVLYAFDGVHTPIGRTDLNDMSVLMLLRYGKTRVLFTGDLNSPLGGYLAKNGRGLEADILKVPHHGTEGVAPNEFFDRVSPRVALVPSPAALWASDRSSRVREHLAKRSVDTFINGLDGTITTLIGPEGYEIHAERSGAVRTYKRDSVTF